MNAVNSSNGGAGMAQPNGSARMVDRLALGAAALISVVSLAMASSAAQATFNSGLVDMQFVGYRTPPLSPYVANGPAVIGSSGDVWNQIDGDSYNYPIVRSLPLNLVDGSTASGATVALASSGTYVVQYGNSGLQNSVDFNLLANELAGYNQSRLAVSITGLNTSLTYNLYLYNAYQQTTYTVNGTGSPLVGTISPTLSANGNFVSGENYLEFTLSPDSTGAITVSMAPAGPSNNAADLSGFQLTVPEPATLGLMAAFGLGVLLLGKRRRA